MFPSHKASAARRQKYAMISGSIYVLDGDSKKVLR
jgi:hypothetical protein